MFLAQVRRKYIIAEEPSFLEELAENVILWVAEGEYDGIRFLLENQEKIPQDLRTVNKPLYRGLIFDSKGVAQDVLENGISPGSDFESWTKSPDVARVFSVRREAVVAEPVLGVVVKSNFSANEVLIDIDALCGKSRDIKEELEDFCRESEVLVKAKEIKPSQIVEAFDFESKEMFMGQDIEELKEKYREK